MIGLFAQFGEAFRGNQVLGVELGHGEHELAVVGYRVEADDLRVIIVLQLVQVLPVRECHAHYIEIDQIITFLISNVERRI